MISNNPKFDNVWTKLVHGVYKTHIYKARKARRIEHQERQKIRLFRVLREKL